MARLRCGGDCRKITTDCTTNAGEDACVLCFAERLKAMARLRCAHFGDGQAAQCSPFLRGRRRCETQHHPLRGLCTFDTTYLGLVLTDFTRG